MYSKLKKLFLAYVSLVIVSACCDTETFNVQIVGIEILPRSSFISEDEDFEFNLRSTDSIVGIASSGFNFQLIQSAHAFGCDDEDTFRPIETISNFRVKVLTDFSPAYQNGDYITDLIHVRYSNGRDRELITETLAEFFDFVEEVDSSTGRSARLQNATYILSERPTVSNQQQLEVDFIFTDNSILNAKTEIITWE